MRRTITPEFWEHMKTAYASCIGLRELARNMKIPEGTVLARAKREGWTQQIQTAKSEAQSDAITPLQSVATTMVQRGQRHQERMAGVTESVLPHLEGMKPGEVLEGIHEIEKDDRMARRNFGLGDSSGGGSLNVNVLTNQAVVQIDQD